MHFPDHAQKSYELWKKYFPLDNTVQNLMKQDMLIHCGSALEIDTLLKADFQLVANLCFSAWAEINANSNMFGGRESMSFKIKYKKLIQRVNQVLKFQEAYERNK